MLLYKNMVLQESGDLAKALAHLEEIEPNVVDRLSLLYTRGARHTVLSPNLTCFSKLTGAGCGQRRSCWAWRGTTRRRSSSSSCWTRTQTITSTTPVCSVPTVVPRRSVSRAALCSRHAGLYRSHSTLPAAEQWSAEHTASLVELYDSIMAADPKAYTAQRIALALVSGEQSHPTVPFPNASLKTSVGRQAGDEFATRLSAYVKRYLRRGIPSLFTDLKALYTDEAKVRSSRDRRVWRGALTDSVVHRLPSSRRSSKESSHRSGRPAHSRARQSGRRPR